MKKFTKINYILTFILVFCIGATLPILIGSSHVDEQHSAKSEVPLLRHLTHRPRTGHL